MAASDVAFLASELVSEAEGPVSVPVPAEGRLGYRFVKRVFDIAFSLCAIAVLLAPSIVLCVAIRLESPGCPIYSQKRVGRVGRDEMCIRDRDSTTTTDRRLRVAMVPPLRAEVLTPMGNLPRTVSVRLPMAAGLIRRAVGTLRARRGRRRIQTSDRRTTATLRKLTRSCACARSARSTPS